MWWTEWKWPKPKKIKQVLAFHRDKKKYFDINVANVQQYVLPFIQAKYPLQAHMRVLEIGCGEGGVLKPFLDMGLQGVGVELDATRLMLAEEFLAPELAAGRVHFVSKDIYKTSIETDLGGKFHLIVLKDVIEHIYDQEKLLRYMQTLLVPNGVIFFGFPPWQMPLGGHQQIMQHKWLSKIPYLHLLPMGIYKAILRSAKENVQEMVEIKETGISIERFERLAKRTHYHILNETHFLINPIYQYKFGWQPRKQFAAIKAVPVLRNFLTTCVYYLLQNQEKN